ncbi:MAG: ion channel [Geminicoccaceae bacterium]
MATKRKNGTKKWLKDELAQLYYGTDRRANGFRFGLLAFDLVTIVFFIFVSFWNPIPNWVYAADVVIGIILLTEFLARFFLVQNKLIFLVMPASLADIIVIGSLLVIPALHVFGSDYGDTFAFLRVLRLLRLLRSHYIFGTLRNHSNWVRLNEDVIHSVINLFVFIFVVTALVYVSQHEFNPQITNLVDALYFTITTLTTTGFGDITLEGTYGRLLAVIIMIFGISLFLRLVQTVFRPTRVTYPCPHCGLRRHDPDAVHCKHCGEVLNIPTEGAV